MIPLPIVRVEGVRVLLNPAPIVLKSQELKCQERNYEWVEMNAQKIDTEVEAAKIRKLFTFSSSDIIIIN